MKWPIVGLYDTEHLWLSPEWAQRLARDFGKVLWVDVDMCWPGARSLSQHVILRDLADRASVNAFAHTVNPSLEGGHSVRGDYANKYPYGTFQWAWWLISRPVPDVTNVIETGLLWMPDGGFGSINNPDYQDNCKNWAVKRLAKSPLAPLVIAGREREAGGFVEEAADHLQRMSGVTANWRNFQYAPTKTPAKFTQAGGVLVYDDPASARGRASYDALLRAIATTFGWASTSIPATLVTFEGTWCSDAGFPADWPAAADRRQIVSIAATGFNKVAYTRPSSSTTGVPALSKVLP
jgi:hypothetical protein